MSTITRKTTTVTKVQEGKKYSAPDYGSEKAVYRPTQRGRNQVVISRTGGGYGGYGGGGSVTRSMSSSMNYGMAPAMAPGAYATMSSQQVTGVKSSREREKKDMQDLNERFASYIEKVRFLEAQNKKLSDELNKLKERWGKETASIKVMYTTELDESRKLLDEAEKDKARLEIRCQSLEDRVEEIEAQLADAKDLIASQKEEIEKQNQVICELETEVGQYKRRIVMLEDQAIRDKNEIKRLTDLLQKTRQDLDAETLNHLCAENRCQSLEEELEFLKGVHEQELKELAALAYRDTTQENREFWKNEMGQALHEIQTVYDEKLDAMRAELEGYYTLKMQEFRTGSTRQGMETAHAKEETKRLRSLLTDLRGKVADLEARNAQLEKELEMLRREHDESEREWEAKNNELTLEVNRLRAEMECILKELQDLMDTKLGLELEIAAYRKLLEGEENRSSGFRGVIESIISSRGDEDDDSSMRMSQVVKGEMSAKTTYQRSAKGPLTISECTADGKCIVIENTGNKKSDDLSGWSIRRKIDNGKVERVYDFNNVTIPSQGKIKICASGTSGIFSGDGYPTFEAKVLTFGVGGNVITSLVNKEDDEKATHTQRTVYTS